jgi:hypothetical protein
MAGSSLLVLKMVPLQQLTCATHWQQRHSDQSKGERQLIRQLKALRIGPRPYAHCYAVTGLIKKLAFHNCDRMRLSID